MSLASTDFMVATGLSNSRSVTSRMDKIDISSVLNALLIKDTNVLGMIPMKGVAKNTEHRWLEDDLNSTVFYGSTSGAAGATFGLVITSPATTALIRKVARKGAIFCPEGGEWYGKFTTAPLGTNTVARHGAKTAVFATIFVTAAAGTKFQVVGMPKSDLATASDDISKARTTRRNFTQVFERGIQIAETREHVDLYAVGSELELQTKYRTLEMKRELGIAVINSYAVWDGSSIFTDNDESRSMAGIIQLIRDPDLDGVFEDTTVTNAGGADLTADYLNAVCKKMYDLGGLGDDSNVVMCVGPTQAAKFSNIATNNLRSTSPQHKYRGVFADRFVSDLGGIEFKVVLDRWVPNDKIIFLDLNRISCMPLQGDTWSLEEKASTGRSRNFQTSGQYTIEMHNAGECHGLLYNLKTT